MKPPVLFARIRPLDASGAHGVGGSAVRKRLAAFDSGSLTMEDASVLKEYHFPRAVFAPRDTQQQLYAAVAAPLVQQVATAGVDAMILA